MMTLVNFYVKIEGSYGLQSYVWTQESVFDGFDENSCINDMPFATAELCVSRLMEMLSVAPRCERTFESIEQSDYYVQECLECVLHSMEERGEWARYSRGRSHYLNGDELDRGGVLCDDCEALVINGVLCHEHGCPSEWRDTPHECYECGAEVFVRVSPVASTVYCDDCGDALCGVAMVEDEYLGEDFDE